MGWRVGRNGSGVGGCDRGGELVLYYLFYFCGCVRSRGEEGHEWGLGGMDGFRFLLFTIYLFLFFVLSLY